MEAKTLTAAIMRKFGFKRIPLAHTKDIFEFVIANHKSLFIEISGKTWMTGGNGDCFIPYSFSYLHDLQTAFPFLTGQELPVIR
jgi:hypothetical protein